MAVAVGEPAAGLIVSAGYKNGVRLAANAVHAPCLKAPGLGDRTYCRLAVATTASAGAIVQLMRALTFAAALS